MSTSEEQLLKASKNGDLNRVKELLENGTDVHTKNNYGYTVLHWSAEYGHKEVAQLLLDHGADVNAKNFWGYTALHKCADYGHKEVVQLLLDYGADVHAKNRYGWTALHYSARNNHKEVAQLLLEHGADVNAKNDYGSTALHKCADWGHKEVVQLLLEYKADQNILFEVWNEKKIVQEFLEIYDCEPDKKHTTELCREIFEPVEVGDWYIVWEDDSVSILQNVKLHCVDPDTVKEVCIQC